MGPPRGAARWLLLSSALLAAVHAWGRDPPPTRTPAPAMGLADDNASAPCVLDPRCGGGGDNGTAAAAAVVVGGLVEDLAAHEPCAEPWAALDPGACQRSRFLAKLDRLDVQADVTLASSIL
ncbi:hypothetical protein ONE63_004853 [Megalurothrips usitatus]|uniref:Uncharacterized protein n=1 Tax=Megalurothrips usitatus TaxID=439358 RepID=A0AAV7X5A9_9NEOP|nr:hypothetical protein ONE63_004853 [Megalurothrips usitatus]